MITFMMIVPTTSFMITIIIIVVRLNAIITNNTAILTLVIALEIKVAIRACFKTKMFKSKVLILSEKKAYLSR